MAGGWRTEVISLSVRTGGGGWVPGGRRYHDMYGMVTTRNCSHLIVLNRSFKRRRFRGILCVCVCAQCKLEERAQLKVAVPAHRPHLFVWGKRRLQKRRSIDVDAIYDCDWDLRVVM